MCHRKNKLKKFKWMLFLLGRLKIPMIAYVSPKLIALDDEFVELKIRLRRRTKNHLGSMYFGALAVGADLAAGIHVFYYSEKCAKKVSVAFKSVQGDFIKRPESDVLFRCTEGKKVERAILSSIELGQRINQEVNVLAFNEKNEVVARFSLTVSVKVL
jgi:acyl-coenzyme A thioesterase PaaI-like protein